MLAFISTVQLVCSKGLYYHPRSDACLAPEKCNSKAERAYRALGQCFFATPQGGDSHAPMPGKDGVYDCPSGQYLLVRNNVATCVDSSAKCDGMYVSKKNQTCVDRSTCSYQLGGYAYREGEYLLCLTLDECTTEWNGFTFDGQCLSVSECRDNRLYAYAATRRCEYSPPTKNGRFNQGQLRASIYDCGDRYLDITGGPRCIRRETCTGVIYEPQRICLSTQDCGRFGYLYDDGTRIQCLTPAECAMRGYFAYEATKTCSPITPETGDKRFVDRADGVYSCGDALLHVGNVASCVTRDQCILDTKGVTIGHVCVDREDWVAKDPRNFIDIQL